MLLNRNNYIRISSNHPQVTLNDSLYQFMVFRRRLHKMFDMIKCDAWFDIMEKNSHASEKNMILKDVYITV
jgi:hypothetical protein